MPLRDQRQQLKNEVFKVSLITTLLGPVFVCQMISVLLSKRHVYLELMDAHWDALKEDGTLADLL